MFHDVLREGLPEPEIHGDLVYKFKKLIGRNDFTFQFRKIITRYRRISPADLWGILSGPGNRVQTFFLD